jgi:hypothetical protein
MSAAKPQNYKNHASFDPWFHVVALVTLVLLLALSITLLVQNIHGQVLVPIILIVLSLVLFLITAKARSYPMKVQDRVIRLEERLRLDALLPEPLRKRIPELTPDQLVALRFASDDEIPSLVELALDKHLTRKEIKERIQNWRPDHLRV